MDFPSSHDYFLIKNSIFSLLWLKAKFTFQNATGTLNFSHKRQKCSDQHLTLKKKKPRTNPVSLIYKKKSINFNTLGCGWSPSRHAKVCLCAGWCTSLLWPCRWRPTLAAALRPLFSLILEGLVSHWPGSHHVSESGWPESPRDHPASLPTLKFNHTTNPADLLHGYWKSNTRPPAWEASTSACSPLPDPITLFLTHWLQSLNS